MYYVTLLSNVGIYNMKRKFVASHIYIRCNVITTTVCDIKYNNVNKECKEPTRLVLIARMKLKTYPKQRQANRVLQ